MNTLVERLKDIKAEILRLKTANQEMQKAEQKHEREVLRLKQLIEIQNSSIKQLEQKLKIKRIADEVSSEDDADGSNNRDLKFKINEMIREVDKIITLIHQ